MIFKPVERAERYNEYAYVQNILFKKNKRTGIKHSIEEACASSMHPERKNADAEIDNEHSINETQQRLVAHRFSSYFYNEKDKQNKRER